MLKPIVAMICSFIVAFAVFGIIIECIIAKRIGGKDNGKRIFY